jgi:hypothetical protein
MIIECWCYINKVKVSNNKILFQSWHLIKILKLYLESRRGFKECLEGTMVHTTNKNFHYIVHTIKIQEFHKTKMKHYKTQHLKWKNNNWKNFFCWSIICMTSIGETQTLHSQCNMDTHCSFFTWTQISSNLNKCCKTQCTKKKQGEK